MHATSHSLPHAKCLGNAYIKHRVFSWVFLSSDAPRRGLCEDDGLLNICGFSLGSLLHIGVEFNDSGKYDMTSRFRDFWDLDACGVLPVSQVARCSVPEEYSFNIYRREILKSQETAV